MNRINLKIAIYIILISLCVISGCRVYSWKVLENSDFPDNMLSTDLKPEILDKYTVGNVIVQPRIVYDDGAMESQKIFVLFFSKETSPKVSIKTVSLSIDGKEFKKAVIFNSDTRSDWEYYKANDPFYVCSISGNSFETIKPERIVHMSLIILVVEKSGKVTEKTICADFVSRKKSYIE